MPSTFGVHVIDFETQLTGPTCPAYQYFLSTHRDLTCVVIFEPFRGPSIDTGVQDISRLVGPWIWIAQALRIANIHIVMAAISEPEAM